MAGPRILVVDDNQELVTLLSRLLEAEGLTPVAAYRGREAVDKIRGGEKLGAAIVDLLLPDMMGYDVANELRKESVPFVFMTGVFKGGKAALDARGKYGATGYFEKPFEAKKLVDAVRSLLPSGAGKREEIPELEPLPDEPLDDFDVEVAVEGDEPAEAMELTGHVVVKEAGRLSATISGERITAGAIGTPARPPPLPSPAPTAAQVKAASDAREKTRAQTTHPEGELGDHLPELITAFYQAQQTGELTVQRGKVKKTIFFDRGQPCFAISNLLTDRFGPFLVRVGKINASQLELVKAAADKTGRRTGDVLVEMRLLNEQEKIYYVAQQVKAIIYTLFGWEDGQYRIHFKNQANAQAIKLDLHPANLIIRGIKKLYKPERLYRLLAPEDRLVPSQDPAYPLHEVELDTWEAVLLPQVNGSRTVAELIRMAKKPDHVVYGALYSLVALRILERQA